MSRAAPIVRFSVSFLIVAGLLLSSGPFPTLAQESGRPVVSSSTEALVEYLVQQAGKTAPSDSSGLWKLLLRHPPFQQFLEGRGIAEPQALGPNRTRILLGEYLETALRRFDDPAWLATRQSASLRRSLWFRQQAVSSGGDRVRGNPGTTPPHPVLERGGTATVLPADGYEALALLSAANRQRLEAGRSRATPPIPPEVQRLLDGLSLVFIHNTHVIREVPDLPLVSSQVIREATGLGGLNTYAFNRYVLRSDDNLFFFVGLQSGPTLGTRQESLYGKYKFAPKPEYAKRWGWISPFVMYPYDLARFGANVVPESTPAFLADFRQEFPDAASGSSTLSWSDLAKALGAHKREEGRWLRVLQRRFAAWLKVRWALGNLDFTVADFEILAREALANHLSRLEAEDPVSFADWQRRLGQGDSGDLLYDALKDTFGLDLFFEFKIPVAIPATALQAVE